MSYYTPDEDYETKLKRILAENSHLLEEENHDQGNLNNPENLNESVPHSLREEDS